MPGGPAFFTYQHQLLAVATANILALGTGCMLGWLSPYLGLLMSADSPLEAPITHVQTAWIASSFPMAAIVGNLLAIFLLPVVGTKWTVMMGALPLISSWCCVFWATIAWHLYLARALAGLTLGISFVSIPMFVTDVADARVRGKLSALMILFFNGGLLIALIVGKHVSYWTFPLIMMASPITFVCGFIGLPDTPQSLLRRRKCLDAERSLRFYRNCSESSEKIRVSQLTEEFARLQQIQEISDAATPISIADFGAPTAIRALTISTVMMAAAQFSGNTTVISFAAVIFRQTHTAIDADTATIVLGTMQLMGSAVASLLIDRVGRKSLLLLSTALCAICLASVATYSLLLDTIGLELSTVRCLPVVMLALFVLGAAAGVTPVPYVILAELLPAKIRQVGFAFGVVTVNLYAFIVMQMFPHLLAAIEPSGCFYMFASFSVIGLVFSACFVRETKGLVVHRI